MVSESVMMSTIVPVTYIAVKLGPLLWDRNVDLGFLRSRPRGAF
jgi:hypothetical protein